MVDGNKKVVLNRVYYYMEEQGMNISDLAEKLGTTHQNVSALLKGINRKNLSIELIERLAKIFDKTLIDMLTPLPADVEVKPPDGRRKQKKI